MKLAKSMTTFTIFSFLISFTSSTSVVDFCVADLKYPEGLAGYPCKDIANVTVNDFVFSGLGMPENTLTNVSNVVKSAFANDKTFPGLNGLGLSMSRLYFGVGGVVPIHTHRSSELTVVIEGTITSGFIGSDNTAYYTTLKKGDIMIIPKGLLHFQANFGEIPALAYLSFNSPYQGVQFTTASLGGNDLPTELIERITLLDDEEVKKLKNIFGGTN